jgi:hypothetical protein
LPKRESFRRKLQHRRAVADFADKILSQIYFSVFSSVLPVYSQLFCLRHRSIKKTGFLDREFFDRVAAVALSSVLPGRI